MTEQPLLNFQPSTSPSPLQAGTKDTPGHARIVIAVTPRSQPVYCEEIQIAVPSESDGGAPYFTAKPTCSCTPEGKWEVFTAAAAEEEGARGPYQFTFKNTATDDDDDTDLIDYPMSIILTGPLGTPTGTLTCTIGEKSTDDNEKRHKLRQSKVDMLVEPQPFYLRNFITHSPSRTSVPQTRFTAGDRVDFTWESNGTSFTLYDGDGTVLYAGTDTHVTLPDGAADTGRAFALTSDTTFTLVAEYTAHGFEPTYLNALVPVTVTNPTVAALTVNGSLAAKSDLNVSDGLVVQGDLQVHRTATVDQQLTATGGISGGYNALAIRNGLNVYGQTTLNSDCDVNGFLSARGDFSVSNGGTEKLTTSGTNGLRVDGDLTSEGKGVVRYGDDVAITGGWGGQRLYVSDFNRPDNDNWHVYAMRAGYGVSLSTWKIERD
ncbi:hypothetical protein [Nocardia barduliensis]|uniref:hypothetical protein n=1 Tax=Nocardia barduliensis TaxID=2736643 RepID=UPI00157382B1|nr:hypothetical protein [Nocardia barduliensis]